MLGEDGQAFGLPAESAAVETGKLSWSRLAAIDDEAEYQRLEEEVKGKIRALQGKFPDGVTQVTMTTSQYPPLTRSLLREIPLIGSADTQIGFRYLKRVKNYDFVFSWDVSDDMEGFSGLSLYPFPVSSHGRTQRLLEVTPMVANPDFKQGKSGFRMPPQFADDFCRRVLAQNRFMKLGLVNELVDFVNAETIEPKKII